MSRVTFDHEYFRTVYHGDYDLHNPPRKAAFCVAQIARVRSGGSLLDVGCAFGSFLAIARQRFEVSGVDVSHDAVEVARARLPGVPIRQASVLDLGADRQFDVVTCFDTLEHVAALDEGLRALRRSMAPGGVLAITVPVFGGPVGRVVRWLDRDPTHVWRQGRKFWEKRLDAHGLRIVRSVGLWRYLLPWRTYLFFGSPLLYRFSPAIMLIGEER